MKKLFLFFCFSLLFVFVTSSQALAQNNKPLKGTWLFMFKNDQPGSLPVPVTFKKGGKGSVSIPTGKFLLIYRESDTEFSAVTELPNGDPVNGNDITAVVRGQKTSTTATGSAFFITDMPDPANPIGFLTDFFTFTGARQK
jgi:hypothetical protein